MFGSDVIKDYYIVYFNFEENKYIVYKYLKNRKLTAKQRWRLIFNNEYSPEIISEGIAENVGQFRDIINKLGLPSKRCEINMTFKSI